MDLSNLITDLVTEEGTQYVKIRGIDLGSIKTFTDHYYRQNIDAGNFKLGLEEVAKQNGWVIRCYATSSNGRETVDYYLAVPPCPSEMYISELEELQRQISCELARRQVFIEMYRFSKYTKA